MAMKVEDTSLWNDPLVRETLENVAADLDGLNAQPALRVLLETDALDALTLSYMIAETGSVFGTLPAKVEAFSEIVQVSNLRQHPEALFAPENASALKLAMAVIVMETTGDGLDHMKAAAQSRKDDFRKGVEVMLEIADRIVETGAVDTLPPALVEKFAEGLDNIKPLVELSSRRKVLAEASASLKYAMLHANADDIAVAAPRVDPESQYARLKPVARAKLRL